MFINFEITNYENYELGMEWNLKATGNKFLAFTHKCFYNVPPPPPIYYYY